MNPYMAQHYNRVARDMNNYIAISAYQYYRRSRRDRGNYLAMYQTPWLMSGGLSGLIAYGLHAIGMPTQIVNYGYHIGYFFDAM